MWAQWEKHFPSQMHEFWVRSWSLAHRATGRTLEGSFCVALECLILELVLKPQILSLQPVLPISWWCSLR